MKTLDYTIFLVYSNNTVEFYGKQVPVEFVKNGMDAMLKDLSQYVGDAFIGKSELKLWGFYIGSLGTANNKLFVRNHSGKSFLGNVKVDPLIYSQFSVFADAMGSNPSNVMPFLATEVEDGESYTEVFSEDAIRQVQQHDIDIWQMPINAADALYGVCEQLASYVPGINVRQLMLKSDLLPLKHVCKNIITRMDGVQRNADIPVLERNWPAIASYLEEKVYHQLTRFRKMLEDYHFNHSNSTTHQATNNVVAFQICERFSRSFIGFSRYGYSSEMYAKIVEIIDNLVKKEYEPLKAHLLKLFTKYERIENPISDIDPKLAALISKMVVSSEELQKMFEDYNQKFFDSVIPNIPVKFNVLDEPFGICHVKRENGKLRPVLIEINCKYNMPIDILKSTLLHEMIHAYTAIIHPGVYVHDAHGWIFEEQAERISKLTGIQVNKKMSAARNITRNISRKSKIPTYIIWFEFSRDDWSNDYKWCIIRTSEKYLESIIAEMKKHARQRYLRTMYKSYRNVHYVPCDEYEYVTLSRTFGKFHGISPEEIEHLSSLKPVTDVIIDYE